MWQKEAAVLDYAAKLDERRSELARAERRLVDGDRMSGAPYYSVLILADVESLQAAGDLKLQAGMPAEVYIEGMKQTALQYLMEPITSTIRRAGREM